ncbi:MAG: alpha/beta fold hydrolase [Candidatus Rokubacteria bacterium]|nr:alpha/beta fold hydrolase [Candidatus Rokubacteria bacterium]
MPTLAVDAASIHYEAAGAGAVTLVLVHGSGGSTAVWRPQMDGLASVARVVALDLPGHGASTGDGFASIDDATTVVRALVDRLGLGPVVIGGHSMGGAVAQHFALTSPERTAGLVLVGTGARLRVMPKIFELIEHDYAAAVRFITDAAVAPGATDAVRAAVFDQTLRTPARVVARDFAACNAFDVMERLADIHAPTLVVCGAEDQLTPPKYAEFLRSRIAGAGLALVAGAGHYVQLERPDEVARAIARFLGTLAAR